MKRRGVFAGLIVGIVTGLAAAGWLVRGRLRSRRDEAGDGTAAGGITDVTGIGPVYAGRLVDAGIASLSDLANADAERVAGVAGVSGKAAAGWIEQAVALQDSR